MLGGRHDPSGHEGCSAYHPVQKRDQDKIATTIDQSPFSAWLVNFWESHLSRLQALVDRLHPERQCGFRKNRSTIDMVFILRLLQEKCIEQNKPLYIVFINLTKAFYTMSRTAWYKVLGKIRYLPKLCHTLPCLSVMRWNSSSYKT